MHALFVKDAERGSTIRFIIHHGNKEAPREPKSNMCVDSDARGLFPTEQCPPFRGEEHTVPAPCAGSIIITAKRMGKRVTAHSARLCSSRRRSRLMARGASLRVPLPCTCTLCHIPTDRGIALKTHTQILFSFYNLTLFKHKMYNCNVTITFSREKPKVINELSFKPTSSPEKKCRDVLLPLFSPMESQLRARMSRSPSPPESRISGEHCSLSHHE